MVSFTSFDLFIIFLFFVILQAIGFIPGKKETDTAEGFLLSGRKVGLILFILTNVATWYGGILGVGEFTYRYGLLSWFTQGLPYYIFAVIFAIFFSSKIREASLFTIPDKLESAYGKTAASVSAVLLFILVSPAPYLFMVASLLSIVLKINFLWCLLISAFLSASYLFRGGYKSYIYADAFQFFVMFGGFILILAAAAMNLGSMQYLRQNLPAGHLSVSGGASYTYIMVWFLIALWTFTDPGFHQRCYAARDGKVARNGILISVLFWALFDFLTTGVGLYSRAAIPGLQNPVLSYPLLAEKLLGSGLKGIFYAAMFATILSTSNSFFFLSATTISNDFLARHNPVNKDPKNIRHYTYLGIILTGIMSVAISYFIPSVIDMWYTIGTICIPGIIFLVISAYYPRLRIGKKAALIEITAAFGMSVTWFFIRHWFQDNFILSQLEPMVIGLFAAAGIHTAGLMRFRKQI
ncbi:MAG: sodium:solute symporter family protein [Syntrophothermus sp.]